MGLTLDENIRLWRASIKNVTPEFFEKEYTYRIRHTYG